MDESKQFEEYVAKIEITIRDDTEAKMVIGTSHFQVWIFVTP